MGTVWHNNRLDLTCLGLYKSDTPRGESRHHVFFFKAGLNITSLSHLISSRMLSSLIADLATVYFMIRTTTLRGDKG